MLYLEHSAIPRKTSKYAHRKETGEGERIVIFSWHFNVSLFIKINIVSKLAISCILWLEICLKVKCRGTNSICNAEPCFGQPESYSYLWNWQNSRQRSHTSKLISQRSGSANLFRVERPLRAVSNGHNAANTFLAFLMTLSTCSWT